jgi:hypothetical protein
MAGPGRCALRTLPAASRPHSVGLASQRRVGQSLIVTFMSIKVSLAAPGAVGATVPEEAAK